MPVSLARHCVELLVLGTIALGPVPWSMVLAGRVPWGPHRLLAALTAWCVLQACGALALGASGALALAPLVVVEVALGATGLAAGPAGLWGARASGVPMVPWPLAMLVGAGALAALTMGIQAAVTPITDYDSLAYHLPTMAQWVYARRIARLTHFASTIRFYPFAWEAVGCAARYLPARSSRIVLGTALCGLVVVGSLWLRTEREVGRRRLDGGLTEFMDKEVDRAEVIGYLLSHRSYLLQGAQIGRPVIYLEDTTGTLSEWVASLRHEGVAVVAIGPLRPWVAGAARGVLARRAWYAVRARLRAGPARRDRRLSPERRLISAVDVAHAPLC